MCHGTQECFEEVLAVQPNVEGAATHKAAVKSARGATICLIYCLYCVYYLGASNCHFVLGKGAAKLF